MNDYTKKVVCIYLPLLGLNLSLATAHAAAPAIKTDVFTPSEAYTIQGNSLQPTTKKIEGFVKDKDGNPIIGASVSEAGTTNGTTTDVNGHFELTIKSSSSLKISYTGSLTQTLKQKKKSKGS